MTSSIALFPTYLLPSLPFRRRPRTTSTDSASSTDSTPSSSLFSFAKKTSVDPTDEPGGEPSSVAPLAPPSPSQTPYLPGHGAFLRCGRCAADLCSTASIVSRGFTGRWGRAYLVSACPNANSFLGTASSPPASSVALNNDPGDAAAMRAAALPNTHLHKPVPRQLVTGAHTVSDVSCAFCGNLLGWKYVDAEEEAQRYKVGKFILETRRVSVAACWEQEEVIHQVLCDDAPAGPTFRRIPASSNDALDEVEFDSQDEDECEDLFAGTWSPSLVMRRRRARAFGRANRR